MTGSVRAYFEYFTESLGGIRFILGYGFTAAATGRNGIIGNGGYCRKSYFQIIAVTGNHLGLSFFTRFLINAGLNFCSSCTEKLIRLKSISAFQRERSNTKGCISFCRNNFCTDKTCIFCTA